MTDQEFYELEKQFSFLAEKQTQVDLSTFSEADLEVYNVESEKLREMGDQIFAYIKEQVPLPPNLKIPILHEGFVRYWTNLYVGAEPEEKADVLERFNQKVAQMSPEEHQAFEKQLGENIDSLHKRLDELMLLVQKNRSYSL